MKTHRLAGVFGMISPRLVCWPKAALALAPVFLTMLCGAGCGELGHFFPEESVPTFPYHALKCHLPPVRSKPPMAFFHIK
jgi:hypothetical protein